MVIFADFPAAWEECTYPLNMIVWLRAMPELRLLSDRKLRLWLCACARRFWEQYRLPSTRQAIKVAEKYADGERTPMMLEWAFQEAWQEWQRQQESLVQLDLHGHSVCYESVAAAEERVHRQLAFMSGPDPRTEFIAQADLLREIFGTPTDTPDYCWHEDMLCSNLWAHHGTSLRMSPYYDPVEWLTTDVKAISIAAYDTRRDDGRFEWLEVNALHDALIDAGCHDKVILEHLKKHFHVKGCWVVDLLLRKE